ncbi:MAG: MerR family transcriptional regulator [Candidatus Marinimicrobia bacterium]|nr:MerR family transcriptional regulator [Candidatus Neomarinimicrobiota bacterium]MBL7046332.1 MerR family transcriptional regulator [Candidatus Neomarinimicrobiota bacterium]
MTRNIQKNLNDDNRPVFTISVAADMINVSVHTLRMYENSGLILPRRTKSKRRMYSRNDIERLRFIRMMIEERGLNIASIKILLSLIPCWDIINCSLEDRENCDAYTNMYEPCWIVSNRGEVCRDKDCRHCSIYSNLSPFADMKIFLKNQTFEHCNKIKEDIKNEK